MTTFGVEYGPYTRLAATFRDRIRGVDTAGPAPATFVDGVAQMAVLDAARHSAEPRRRVDRRRADASHASLASPSTTGRSPVDASDPRTTTGHDVPSHHGRGAAGRMWRRTGEPPRTSTPGATPHSDDLSRRSVVSRSCE